MPKKRRRGGGDGEAPGEAPRQAPAGPLGLAYVAASGGLVVCGAGTRAAAWLGAGGGPAAAAAAAPALPAAEGGVCGVAADGANGRVAVACAAAKRVEVFDARTGAPLAAAATDKRPGAVAFSPGDAKDVLFANRFGDVFALAADGGKEARHLLGHYSSIITGVLPAASGKLLYTADRDEKVRVTNIELDDEGAIASADEIASFCLGHEAFVSCLAQCAAPGPALVSGSGDGTLRAWDPETGTELGALALGASEGDGPATAVAALAAHPTEPLLVAALAGRAEVVVIRATPDGGLAEAQRLALPDLGPFAPVGVAFDGAGRLWAVGGGSVGDVAAFRIACAESAAPGAPLAAAPPPEGATAALEGGERDADAEAKVAEQAGAVPVVAKATFDNSMIEKRKQARSERIFEQSSKQRREAFAKGMGGGAAAAQTQDEV